MKKTVTILSLALLMGCHGFLDVYPETSAASENFYRTPAEFTLAVNGAYAPLQGIYTARMWAFGEMRSDNTTYQRNPGDRSGFALENIDEFLEQTDNTHLTNFLNDSYKGVARCNVILEKIEGVSFDQAIEDIVIGQASFLRALYFFNLVRVFGDVPLPLTEVKTIEQSFELAKRRPAADVYATIIADAKTAIGKLPAKYAAAVDKGRATQGSARTLLAEVYMTLKNFAAAEEQLRAVVGLNTYDLAPAYADNFDITKENGIESVFEIQYIEGATLNESSNFIYTFAPYNSVSAVAGFAVSAGSAAGWNVATQDLLDAYEDGDVRKAVSIGFDFVDPNNSKNVPYAKKFKTPHAVQFQTGSNFVVYRYADVLLMLAECVNNNGYVTDGEAFDLLNDVRQRASLAPKTSANADPELMVADQQAFAGAVAHERQVELAFENHRWFDLVRTDKATEVMLAHGTREKAAKNYVPAAGYVNIPSVFPYPQRELLLLEQR